MLAGVPSQNVSKSRVSGQARTYFPVLFLDFQVRKMIDRRIAVA